MTLSDKIDWCSIDCGIDDNDEDGCYMILEEDVKEFIKKLKEDFLIKEYKDFEELVNKLAGDKLI